MSRISLKFASLILGFVYLIIQMLSQSAYGINWDEPNHYLRGQAAVRYFLTGKKDYRGLPKLESHYPKEMLESEGIINDGEAIYKDDTQYRRSFYQYDREGDKFSYRFFEYRVRGHPILNDILASFSNYFFYQKLGLLGDIESYHLFVIFLSSVLVGVMLYFIATIYGLFAGIVSVLSLILYPLFLAESHFNIKDPVETAFYSFTLLTFYYGVVRRNWKIMLLSTIFAGFALGTKFNIFFAGVTALVWFIAYKWKELKRCKWLFSSKFTVISVVAFLIIPFGLFVVSWPSMWSDPIGGFLKTLSYYKEVGYGHLYQPQSFLTFFGFNTYPALWVLYTTPLVTLALGAAGIWAVIKNRVNDKHKFGWLALLWFVVPILRISLPNMSVYGGGSRQIMEFIPGLAILTGVGATYVVKILRNKGVNAKLVSIIILILFIPIAYKMYTIHPNQNVYFNPLIGGLKGAKARGFPGWGSTLGSTYQQGVVWLNENAEEGATVSLVRGLMSNIPIVNFRRDLNYIGRYWSGEAKDGEYLIEVIDDDWVKRIPLVKRQYLYTLNPVYSVRVDGVTILNIWKNDQENTKL